jgi:hypothetical protein
MYYFNRDASASASRLGMLENIRLLVFCIFHLGDANENFYTLNNMERKLKIMIYIYIYI